ncbi:MAG: hypothetical protein VX938_05185, partial [Myxococcota bacterium]|nr:hypothetical protein [Myxococcota bacterium]
MTSSIKRWCLVLLITAPWAGASCSSADPGQTQDGQGIDGELDASVSSADAQANEVSGCPEGTPCDDGQPCTGDDVCDATGLCVGVALDCDDGLDCTTDQCVEGECVHALGVDRCISDGEPPLCLDLGAPDPRNTCRLCAGGGASGSEWTELANGAPCDDHDACTLGDLCEVGACVSKNPKQCPEAGPCSVSVCDPETGCGTDLVDGPCEDGDACTVGDICASGECAPGQETLLC